MQTATPARLLVMLYDRLVLDCRRALEAQQTGDHDLAHEQLVHAQDIVAELRATLRPDVWQGGADLEQLYGYLHVALVRANVNRDGDLTAHCLDLVTGLADAWRDAATHAAAVGA